MAVVQSISQTPSSPYTAAPMTSGANMVGNNPMIKAGPTASSSGGIPAGWSINTTTPGQQETVNGPGGQLMTLAQAQSMWASQPAAGTTGNSNSLAPVASSAASSPYAASTPNQTSTYGSNTAITNSQNTANMSGMNGPFASQQAGIASSATNTNAAGQAALATGMAGLGSTIYNQQLQQEQNQTNVNEAQRGITMSPYGAGVANQADINFNTNWQTNQLAMDQAGINAANSGASQASTAFNSNYGNSTSGSTTGSQSGYGTNPITPQTSQVQSTSVSQPQVLPYPTSTVPQSSAPQTAAAQPLLSPGQLYPGTNTSNNPSTGMMTPAGTSYQQIVNPTPAQNAGPQGTLNQATGGDQSQYPLNGPSNVITDPTIINNQEALQQAINPSSSVILDPNSMSQAIMGVQDDSTANQLLSSPNVLQYFN